MSLAKHLSDAERYARASAYAREVSERRYPRTCIIPHPFNNPEEFTDRMRTNSLRLELYRQVLKEELEPDAPLLSLLEGNSNEV